jgi:hypothetical protein
MPQLQRPARCLCTQTTAAKTISLSVAGKAEVVGPTPTLRDAWEETAFQLERLQAAEETVASEQAAQSRCVQLWLQGVQALMPYTCLKQPLERCSGLLPAGFFYFRGLCSKVLHHDKLNLGYPRCCGVV